MKQVLRYQTADGRIFADWEKAAHHENLCDAINSIMANLPARPDSCDFVNGHGYIQHDRANLRGVRTLLLKKIAAERDDLKEACDKAIADEKAVHPTWIARMLDDDASPLTSAWYRLLCIDDQHREWGQPYFAANPTEARSQKAIETKGAA